MKLRRIYPAFNRRMFRAMARGNINRALWLQREHLRRYRIYAQAAPAPAFCDRTDWDRV